MLYSQRAIDSASPIPTTERPMPMMDHGRTLYVTAQQDHTLGILNPAMMLATFATIATGFYVTGYLRHVARIFFEENDKAEIKP